MYFMWTTLDAEISHFRTNLYIVNTLLNALSVKALSGV